MPRVLELCQIIGKIGPIGADVSVAGKALADMMLKWFHLELVLYAKVVKGFKPQNRVPHPNDEFRFRKVSLVIIESKRDVHIRWTFDPHDAIWSPVFVQISDERNMLVPTHFAAFFFEDEYRFGVVFEKEHERRSAGFGLDKWI